MDGDDRFKSGRLKALSSWGRVGVARRCRHLVPWMAIKLCKLSAAVAFLIKFTTLLILRKKTLVELLS